MLSKMTKRKKKATPSKRTSLPGVVTDDDFDIVEVPAPASSDDIVLSGIQDSPIFGDNVEWWIARYEGSFGWQLVAPDGSSTMSYLDGVIYHYSSDIEARQDLEKVLGV